MDLLEKASLNTCAVERARAEAHMSSLATAAWDERLLEVDAAALRYRMTANRLRLGRHKIDELRNIVSGALDAELHTLEALEAEAVRQHEQQKRALKFGQYLAVLSAHLEAASGGNIGMLKLPPESDEVRQALAEVGVPLNAPLQILHMYRVKNARLREDFNARLKGDHPAGKSPGASPVKPGGSPGGTTALPAPYGYTHRLLAIRLAPAAVEHTLVHGLRPKPDAAHELDWQVDPNIVPEAGCVDMKSLAGIVGASLPPPTPLALFAGAPAWEALLQGEVEEAITARDAAAAGLATARGDRERRERERSAESRANDAPDPAPAAAGAASAADPGTSSAGAARGTTSSKPTNKLLLLVRVLLPRTSEAPSPDKHNAASSDALRDAYHLPTRSYPPARHAVPPPPPPGTATAAPELILPLYLVHYGTMTAPPLEPRNSASGAGATGSEKSVAQKEERVTAEPKAAAQQGDKSGGASSTKDGKRAGRSGSPAGKGPAAAAPPLAEDEQPIALPAALRSTREFEEYLKCKESSGERMREVATVFANAIDGLAAQHSPARAQSQVEEARREAELQMLLADAKAELAKLKKTNRELASELQTTY